MLLKGALICEHRKKFPYGRSTYTTFPLLSEVGVMEMVIVFGVTSSSATPGGNGGGGATKMHTTQK